MRNSYGTSPVPHFILRGRGAGNSILLPDTDVRDAEWIADLLAHGLLKGSFIPPTEQRDLRELTRYRCSLVEERARTVNRLQKTLEDTNRDRWQMWRPTSWASRHGSCWMRYLQARAIRMS